MRMTRLGSERGAAAAIVAVTLPLIFGMALITVDAGRVWSTRRTLVTATDAAALAGAQAAALMEQRCQTANAMLELNSPGAQPTECTSTGTADAGIITVSASSAEIPVSFGGVLGVGPQRVTSSSSAAYGSLYSALGLRPIGLCLNDAHLQHWMGKGPDTGAWASPGVRRVSFTKRSPDACGHDAPGNWGWIDFDAGNNSNAATMDWLLNGYPDPVGVDDCNGDDVLGDPCQGAPGSTGGSVAAALNSLIASKTEFPVVIYDHVIDGGANVHYRVYGFLGVVLRGYRVTGAESQRYFDFEFDRIVLQGLCCDGGGLPTGAIGIKLCASDHSGPLGCVPGS